MQKFIKRVKTEKIEIDEKAFNVQVSFENSTSHSMFENILMFILQDDDDCSESRLEDYVNKYFTANDNAEKLKVILPGCLSDMCQALAEFGDEYSAKRIVEYETKQKRISIRSHD